MEYPTIDAMISFIEKNADKKATKIDLENLSINGVCVCDEMEDYLAKKAISSSSLKECLKSPKAFLMEYEGQFSEYKNQKKDFLELGTIIHKAILEPSAFDKAIVKPRADLRSSEGVRSMIRFYNEIAKFGYDLSKTEKASYKDLRELLTRLENECCQFLVYENDMAIVDAVKVNYKSYGNGIIPKLLKGAMSEISMYAKEPMYMLDAKIRPDFINIEENIGVNIIGSIKTTSAEDIRAFIKQCVTLNYDVSEGFYQDLATHITGRQFNATVMIVLQTVPPFETFVLWWTPDSLDLGKYKANHALSTISECFEIGQFLGLETKAEQGNHGIIELELPKSAFKELAPVSTEL